MPESDGGPSAILVTSPGDQGGRDVEQGEDKRERSWYKLIGTALRHVWPHNFGMQVLSLWPYHGYRA